uniref:Uncharacterized protein n=1 Tax=Mola mola TaxID=94237 RepID=A0A3Q3X681_MOLML
AGSCDNMVQSSSTTTLTFLRLLLLIVPLVFSSSFCFHKFGKEPPGPKSLPLAGNLLQLDLRRPWKTLLELSKKYGSLYTIYLGPKKVVVLAGYKTVKEALVNYAHEFGNRDQMLIMNEFNQGYGKKRIIHKMRRFALTNLRDFGMGKRACEDKIIEECHHLIGVIKKFKGEAFDSALLLYCAISNIICSMVYGSRFDYDDPVFFGKKHKKTHQTYEFHKLSAASRKHTLGLLSHLKETLNPDKCRGVVDAFLTRRQSLEGSGITNSHFHNENLLHTIMNLFAAGTDTTATTVRWGLLFMARYPKIQDKVQEELRRVIGSRQAQVEDRKNLPFTNAVIHETQRVANISPVSLPHVAHKDVTFQGHFIKKGTTVYPLLASVLFDESEWEHPHSFYPAHFLDKEGNFVKRDAFLPFSAGRRACPGEGLARMELFIFITTLLQHFRFTPQAGDELDLTPRVGLILSPSPHKLYTVSCM